MSAMSGIARLFYPNPKYALTTILYHRFISPHEAPTEARDRLKYQLEWLKERYTPLNADKSLLNLQNGINPPYPLHVTADDAFVDLLNVKDIFKDFEIQLTVFVCTGWIDNNENDDYSSLARIADFIRWYNGEPLCFTIDQYDKIELNEKSRDIAMDQIILNAKQYGENYIQKTWDYLKNHRLKNDQRRLCDWSELKQLQQEANMVMASHSVTHCPLADTSPTRLKFELEDSKKTLKKHFGKCDHFAYPFGTKNVVNDQTTQMLQEAGYKSGYLTKASFADQKTNPYHIPRIVIPDHKISLNEFKARAKGGTIPFDAMKRLFA